MELDTTEANRLQQTGVFSRPMAQMRSSLSLFRGHQGGCGSEAWRARPFTKVSTSVLYLQSALVNRMFPPFHVTGSLLQIPGPPDLRIEQLSGSSLGIMELLDFAL